MGINHPSVFTDTLQMSAKSCKFKALHDSTQDWNNWHFLMQVVTGGNTVEGLVNTSAPPPLKTIADINLTAQCVCVCV